MSNNNCSSIAGIATTVSPSQHTHTISTLPVSWTGSGTYITPGGLTIGGGSIVGGGYYGGSTTTAWPSSSSISPLYPVTTTGNVRWYYKEGDLIVITRYGLNFELEETPGVIVEAAELDGMYNVLVDNTVMMVHKTYLRLADEPKT